MSRPSNIELIGYLNSALKNNDTVQIVGDSTEFTIGEGLFVKIVAEAYSDGAKAHKDLANKVLGTSMNQLLIHCGEMTVQEQRTVKSVTRYFRAKLNEQDPQSIAEQPVGKLTQRP